MSALFESTVEDIFKKFDMLMNKELGYCEFKGFCDCVAKVMTENEFSVILERYSSTKFMYEAQNKAQSMPANMGPSEVVGGLTLEGFKRFLVGEIEDRNMNEEFMFTWLQNLGYDADLFSVRSRCFMLTLHSSNELQVTVRDAVQTDLDMRTNLLVI